MKWYSQTTYRQHLKDLESFKDSDELRQVFMTWPKTISNRFEKTWDRIGVIDTLDLLQEGYLAFYEAWKGLNWDKIAKLHEDEQPAMITNYIKLRIKDRIQRSISKNRDTIRIPENYYRTKSHSDGKYYEYQTDIFLTRTFSSFFTQHYLDVAEEVSPYDSEEIYEVLEFCLDTFCNKLEKIVLKMFYGIDEPYDKPRSMKGIGEYCWKTVSNIQNIKHRGLNKLKQPIVKEIIENKLYNQ